MKINLKVRLRNPIFWLTMIPALCTFVYTVLMCFDIVPAIGEETAVRALTAIVTALSTLGVLVDPTTPGVEDSERAMQYDEPGGQAQ